MATDAQQNFVGPTGSFSGSDIRVAFSMPAASGKAPLVQLMNNVQTISYSIFREKSPVRALGFVGEKGRSRGARTIAGSIVFTVFDRHVIFDMLRKQSGDANTNSITTENYSDLSYVMIDQMPPFDIIISFANEAGFVSEMVIFGVEFSAEGQVMSIDDLLTENTVQYTASHISLMRPGGYVSAAEAQADGRAAKTFSSIMNSAGSASLRKLVEKTRNPFR